MHEVATQKRPRWRAHGQAIETVVAPVPIVVEEGEPPALTPTHWLVTRAAGTPPMVTVGLPSVIEPVQAEPTIWSPITVAGMPSMLTVGIPGPVIVSPDAVVSPILSTGVGMLLCF